MQPDSAWKDSKRLHDRRLAPVQPNRPQIALGPVLMFHWMSEKNKPIFQQESCELILEACNGHPSIPAALCRVG